MHIAAWHNYAVQLQYIHINDTAADYNCHKMPDRKCHYLLSPMQGCVISTSDSSKAEKITKSCTRLRQLNHFLPWDGMLLPSWPNIAICQGQQYAVIFAIRQIGISSITKARAQMALVLYPASFILMSFMPCILVNRVQ